MEEKANHSQNCGWRWNAVYLTILVKEKKRGSKKAQCETVETNYFMEKLQHFIEVATSMIDSETNIFTYVSELAEQTEKTDNYRWWIPINKIALLFSIESKCIYMSIGLIISGSELWVQELPT
jgi:hypothetical protein